MPPMVDEIVNWATFAETRATLGDAFVRVLGYYREDGTKSVAEIEAAMRDRDSARLVMPAHTLKGESWQFGADALAELAEEIELTARQLVEFRQDPEQLLEKIVLLRPLFEATLTALQQETSPLVERRAAVGSRMMGQFQQSRY